MQLRRPGNKFRRNDLVPHSYRIEGLQREPVMNSRINSEQIDYKTSRSICDAVGERLQQNLRPDSSQLSPYLQQLLDELRKQDREAHQRRPN